MTPDKAEYTERLRRVRESMRQRSLGALVVCDPANLFYLTGYDAWSFYTPQCLLVPTEDGGLPANRWLTRPSW